MSTFWRRSPISPLTPQNRVLEKVLHSGGLPSLSKKRYRDELSRLAEQDQQLLRQENEQLRAEVLRGREDLLQCRETVTVASKMSHRRSTLPSNWTWNLFLTPAGATAGRDSPVTKAARSVLGGKGAGGGERRSEAGAGGPEGKLQRKQSSRHGWMCLSRLLTVPPVLPEGLRRTRPGAAGEPSAGERSSEDADVPNVLAAH